MPYLACLPRLSFVPATAQQFRRSTYLNPLESPLKNQHFALKTCQTIISESPAFECLPDNANTQGLSFQPIFIIWSQTGSSFSPAFVWLLCTFQRANHCLARQPYHDLRRRLSGTTIHKNDHSAVYPHFSGISDFTLSQSHRIFSRHNITNPFTIHNRSNLLHTFLHINTHLLFSLVQIYRPPVQPGSSVRKTLQSS